LQTRSSALAEHSATTKLEQNIQKTKFITQKSNPDTDWPWLIQICDKHKVNLNQKVGWCSTALSAQKSYIVPCENSVC